MKLFYFLIILITLNIFLIIIAKGDITNHQKERQSIAGSNENNG
jgi:hypothetical protein